MASHAPRLSRVLSSAIPTALSSSGTCTVEVSSDHDCDDREDPDCEWDADALGPPPQVLRVFVIEPDGSEHRDARVA
jgi:hypothetical protein